MSYTNERRMDVNHVQMERHEKLFNSTDWLYAEGAFEGCPRCRNRMKPKNMCLNCGRIVEFYDHEVVQPKDRQAEEIEFTGFSRSLRFWRWLRGGKWRRN